MKTIPLFFVMVLMISTSVFSQVSISTDNSLPDNSAMLEVKSTARGFLPPRLTTLQRNAIANPKEGLIIYNSNCGDIQYFNGGGWVPIGNTGILSAPGSVTGASIVCPNTANVTYVTSSVPGATGYGWIIPEGAVIVSGQGSNVVTLNFGTSGGTICVYAYNTCYKSQVSCLDVYVGAPGAPPTSAHTPTKTTIIWNWGSVTGATGYKWNTINDITTAADLGNVLTYTESGLVCNTVYSRYVWAYNQCLNSTGTQLTQSTLSCIGCPSTLTDTRDGKIYNTIAIGSQCWMKENLNIGIRINGMADQTNNLIIEKYCTGDNEANCTVYGGLYQWGELVQYLNGASNTTNWFPAPTGQVQGICPQGWHIPDEAEWCTMSQFLDPTVDCNAFNELGTTVGLQLKEAGTVHWAAPNAGATNSSNFTALPHGSRYDSGSFNSFSYNAYFWTSTTTYELSARFRSLSYSSGGIFRSWNPKTSGYSVRCIIDN